MVLTLGEKAPDFTALISDNTPITLSKLKGNRVVLFFYPKDDTPGCTSEGKAFSEAFNDFKKTKTKIYGISKDSLASHDAFRRKYHFPFDLISDPEEIVCKRYDVIKLKKMYGREFMGIERSTFLIDSSGILQHAWKKVRVQGHVQDVLQAAQMLK